MKAQIHALRLIYCPISNQEAEWIKDDSEVQHTIGQSNLYMIAQRAEARFLFNEEELVKTLASSGEGEFVFVVGDLTSKFTLDFREIIESKTLKYIPDGLDFEFGKKLIRIWAVDEKNKKEKRVIEWFTTEKILWDKYRGMVGICGLDDYRKFTEYILHYVGISKKEDSLTRLVIKPHDKRLRILSNEVAIKNSARVTDELMFFFFRIEPLRISSCDFGDEEAKKEMLKEPKFDRCAIVADAEKAFVKILKSEYNSVKFDNYPKGEDGLYGSGLDRYAYLISDDISFLTATERIEGKFCPYSLIPSEGADLIAIEGDEVKLIKRA